MKMLRKTIKAIVIIALLKIVMLVLDKYSPSSTVFHRQLLFSVQLVIIVWLLLSLLLFVFKAGRSWVARFLPILIVMLVLGIDVLFTYWMERPAKVPGFLKNEFKNYYALFERNIIEYEPCSVYDSVYAYRFIPGLAFSFGNTEFKNNYQMNSESFRDDENSLGGADVVCTGNAYTLGVGVDQNADYPALLGTQTGLNVLNAGYPSFGTARQLLRVVNTDTSVLRYLVIQYSKYDVYENAAYVNNKDQLYRMSDSAYKKAKQEYRWRREYFPGKYAITITYDYLKAQFNKLRKKRYYLSGDNAASAKYFLQVLDAYKLNDKVKILVTEVNDYNDMNSGFLGAIDSLLKQNEFAHLKDRVQTFDLSKVLNRDDYYIIDSDLRPSGQSKIAKTLSEYITQTQQ